MWEEKGLWEAATSLQEACARGMMCHGTSFAETKNGKKRGGRRGEAGSSALSGHPSGWGPWRSHQSCVGAPGQAKSWGQEEQPGTHWPGASKLLSPVHTLSPPCSCKRVEVNVPAERRGHGGGRLFLQQLIPCTETAAPSLSSQLWGNCNLLRGGKGQQGLKPLQNNLLPWQIFPSSGNSLKWKIPLDLYLLLMASRSEISNITSV